MAARIVCATLLVVTIPLAINSLVNASASRVLWVNIAISVRFIIMVFHKRVVRLVSVMKVVPRVSNVISTVNAHVMTTLKDAAVIVVRRTNTIVIWVVLIVRTAIISCKTQPMNIALN